MYVSFNSCQIKIILSQFYDKTFNETLEIPSNFGKYAHIRYSIFILALFSHFSPLHCTLKLCFVLPFCVLQLAKPV